MLPHTQSPLSCGVIDANTVEHKHNVHLLCMCIHASLHSHCHMLVVTACRLNVHRDCAVIYRASRHWRCHAVRVISADLCVALASMEFTCVHLQVWCESVAVCGVCVLSIFFTPTSVSSITILFHLECMYACLY